MSAELRIFNLNLTDLLRAPALAAWLSNASNVD
jgi:hypothetical protein